MLAHILDPGAATPIYAILKPRAIATAFLFPLLAGAFVLLAPRLADPARTSRRAFVASLLAAAVLLPLALYCVRETPATLGQQFTLYVNEEFFQDAARLASSGASGREFVAHYVEIMPQLSLHGRHFPPGHALLLYGIAQVFGPSVQAAGYSVLAIAAGGVVCAFLA